MNLIPLHQRLSTITDEQIRRRLFAAGLNEFHTSLAWCDDCEERAGYGDWDDCSLCAAAKAAGIGAPK